MPRPQHAGAQRVRVRVVDAITRDDRKDVHVKVIGTGMNTFVTGDTDLRGVFSAEGVSGYPTAVARDAAGHSAFYRSEAVLALMAAPRLPESAARAAVERKSGKADYLSNVQSENRQIQMGNQVVLEQLYQQPQQRGVEVKKSH